MQSSRLDFLFDELRRVGVLGNKAKNAPAILYQSKSCVLFRFISSAVDKKVFCSVIRSSRQCYKVVAFSTYILGSEEFIGSFRSYSAVAGCLKNLFKEV